MLPTNFTLKCGNKLWKQVITSTLENGLESWQPVYPVVLIIDELWGYAFNYPVDDGSKVKIVLTTNPCKEYWEDLDRCLRPNLLLAGEHTPESLFDVLKIAKPDQYLKLTPPYQSDLTPKELEVLHHLARIKTDKQIATIMGITAGTVANHLNRITKKLGLSGREEAGLYYWGMSDIAKSLKW
jgi:DNA-binding CsgD family transcriptional regulator